MGKEESNEDSSTTDSAAQPQKKKLPLHHSLTRVVAQLEMKPLWDEFHELGTEMIVTKAGRLDYVFIEYGTLHFNFFIS